MTTTDVKYIDGNLFVTLRGFNIENDFLTQLPMNEYDDNFNEQLNDINYKRMTRKLHDAGW